MDFKYKSTFQMPGITVLPFSFEKDVAKASLENLTSLIPNQEINFDDNIDLLGVAFNAAVINKFNKNDDGIDTQTAVRIANLFRHKPTNIEHKKDKVVGHILTAGFSKYGDSEILTPTQLENYNDAFNLSLGAVVYKFVNKDFASALEDSATNPNSQYYGKISTSWELGFNEYKIAVGSDSLKEAEIISDEKQIQELKGKLKAYGGDGKLNDGTRIYRLVVGEIFPLGIGYTTSPAADVNGIVVNNDEFVQYEEQPKSKIYSFKNHFFSKKDSQSKNINVNHKKQSAMELENLVSEVREALLTKKISEEAAANMTATFTEAIKKKDQEYRNELQSAKEAAENLTKERAELKASVEEVQKQLADALSKLSEFENEKRAAQALARFNSRMEEIDQMFDLDDEDRQVLADDIKSIGDSDEAFASYKNKLSVIWRSKNKEAKSEIEKQIQARIDEEVKRKLEALKNSTASKTESVEQILDKAKAVDSELPNNNQQSSKAPQSLIQRFADAFKKENIIIS
jgi:hypothetical protein